MGTRTKILYVQHEMYTWQRAKMWSHNFHLGIENGFMANEMDFTTLVTAWLPAAKELLKDASFDQVWINDIAHAFRDGGCGGYQVREDDIAWLAGLAPIRVGFVNETLQYSAEEYASNSGLYELQQALQKSAKYTTHMLAVDERDIEFIQSQAPARVMWMVPCMPENFICRQFRPSSIRKGLFMGMPYGARARWLEMPELQGLLAKHESLDNRTDIPDRFDDLHTKIPEEMAGHPNEIKSAYASYLWELRQMRKMSFSMYLEGMREGAAVVHLPSYCKVYNSRVYEGMAAGRPVITSRGDDRPRLDRLFGDGRDLLIYPADDPHALAKHIRTLLNDPEYGAAIALRARDKLLAFHTAEKRVSQILEWIATGNEPFGADAGVPDDVMVDKDKISSVQCASPVHSEEASNDLRNITGTQNDKLPPCIPKPNKKLRILLIRPPHMRLMGLGNGRFPLGLGTLGTMLAINSHTVAIYDADFQRDLFGKSASQKYAIRSQDKINAALRDKDHFVWQEIDHTIRTFDPDVIGIAAMSNTFPMAAHLAEMTKTINRDITVVVGGRHASIFGSALVQDQNIDFAVIGEGEITFLELINRLCDPKSDFTQVQGLIYKEGARTVTNRSRDLLRYLDILPIADRDLMINDGYIAENSIMASRGGQFHCGGYGIQTTSKHNQRHRSVPGVIREIEYLFQRGPSRTINFLEDSFARDRRYAVELTTALKHVDGLDFSCTTRIGDLDREMLTHLKEGGCAFIRLGIASGSDQILQKMDKKMSRALIEKQTAMINAVGIPWLGLFNMGYPGESKEEILETLEFMQTLGPSRAEINIFNPLPGTRAWEDLEIQGLVDRDLDFSQYLPAGSKSLLTAKKTSTPEFDALALFVAKAFDAYNSRVDGKYPN